VTLKPKYGVPMILECLWLLELLLIICSFCKLDIPQIWISFQILIVRKQMQKVQVTWTWLCW
jgi:hypothetical protein